MKEKSIFPFRSNLFMQNQKNDTSDEIRIRHTFAYWRCNVKEDTGVCKSQIIRISKPIIIIILWMLISNSQILGNINNDSTIVLSDTLARQKPEFTPESASDYIRRIIGMEQLWKSNDDTIKNSLFQLLGHFKTPYDTTRARLMNYNFTAVDFDSTFILESDTLPLRWIGKALFIVDTIPLEQSPHIIQKTINYKMLEPDSSFLQMTDSIPLLKRILDSLIITNDTVSTKIIDFSYLESKKIKIHQIDSGRIIPPVFQGHASQTIRFTEDSSQLIATRHLPVLMAKSKTPFFILPNHKLPDSLQEAVTTLLSYTWNRDSVQLFLSGIDGNKTPFWLSNNNSDLYRYWLRNSKNDSITIWLGNPTKYHLSMKLEEGVHVERMGILAADDIPFIKVRPKKTLAPAKPLEEIPVYWDLGFIGSMSLNQNYITYWAQGGESSFAGLLDLNGNAKYSNKDKKSEWLNSGRLRYGNIWTKDKGARVNTDILEINSQYNKVVADKLDFSSVFYFKTQIAKGYNYPNDSVTISKFLNPGTFTIGIGAEYSPIEKTLINLSPLSYKTTFVLDTANIDQTIHGIAKDSRLKREIGGQLVIKNNFTFLDEIKVTNTLRLFSSYANKPQNIDVDWEMTLERRISWIFYIKLNVHLIYDDDILFTVTNPEGNEIKAPRTQLNQFLGLSISLNL